jgi:hypothetical protein
VAAQRSAKSCGKPFHLVNENRQNIDFIQYFKVSTCGRSTNPASFASNPRGFPFARLAGNPYTQPKDIMSGTFIEHVWC